MNASERLVAVRPPIYRGWPYVRIVLVLGALALFRGTRTSGRLQANLFNDWLLYALIVVGFYFVFGLSGQFAFSQAAIFGLGAYSSYWATANHSHPFLLGPLAAIVVCGAVAFGFSLLMQRTAHFYFAVGTLALSEIIILFVSKAKWFTHFAGGETLNIRPISLAGHPYTTYWAIFWVLIVVMAALLSFGYLLERSPVRREAIAIRDREMVSRTLGLPALRLRSTMFVLGSCVAGVAGSLWGHRAGSITLDQFGVDLGLGIFLMLILGGSGSIWGGLLGAWFYVYVQDYLHRINTTVGHHKIGEFWGLIYGGLLIVVMVAVPDGLIGVVGRFPWIRKNRDRAPLRAVRRALGLPAPRVAPPPEAVEIAPAEARPDAEGAPAPVRATTPGGEAVLTAAGIRVNFGGVRAVNDVSMTLRRGEILGLIGPNGSGKSTFLNALTGVVPASGNLSVGVRAIPLGDPGVVRRAGVLRTYQTPQTFLQLACIENVLLSSADRRYTGIVAAVALRPIAMAHERRRWLTAAEALDRVGLLALAEQPASALSYGQQRMLELARIIAGDPDVVLLDEPSAGLNATETAVLASHLQRLRAEGTSLLVVDHKIDFISSLCDRIVVFELGQLVAEGDPRTIWEDERVVNAYLGVAAEA